jgi:hypothetical protein
MMKSNNRDVLLRLATVSMPLEIPRRVLNDSKSERERAMQSECPLGLRCLGIRGVLLAALICGGCTSGTKLVPVTGRLLIEGRPAGGAYIQFHPEGENSQAPRPSARVKADGSFELSTPLAGTVAPRAGAPPGRYGVTVMLRTASKVGDSDEVDLLPRRYLFPSSSGLSAVVNDIATEVPPIDLKKK